MRKAEFTNEQIIGAGKELKADNQKISGWALRTKLGGGKPARLAEVWNSSLDNSDEVVESKCESLPLPAEVQEAVSLLSGELVKHTEETIVRCNTIATQTADKRVASTIQEMKLKISEAEETEIEANTAIEQCDNKAIELAQLLSEQSEHNKELVKVNAMLETKVKVLNERIERLELFEKQHDQLEKDLVVAKHKNDVIEEKAKSLVSDFQESKESAGRLEQKVIKLNQEVALLEQKNNTLQQANKVIQSAKEAELKSYSSELKSAQKQVTQIEKENHGLVIKVEQLGLQVAEQSKTIKALASKPEATKKAR